MKLNQPSIFRKPKKTKYPIPIIWERVFFLFNPKTANKMYELFIELTNQIFWEGYAEQMAIENPAVFQFDYNEFMKAFKN